MLFFPLAVSNHLFLRSQNLHRSTHFGTERNSTTFIRSAIRVIAQKGLVKATTKAIAADAGLNEAYIYKCFKGKDELLAEALHDRDEGLAVFLRREFPNVLAETSPWRDRCFHLWEKTWKFILDKRDDCIFYLRYYSSPDFYAYEHDRQ